MYHIGIDIGGTTIKAGVVSKKGIIIHKVNAPTVRGDVDDLINSIVDLVDELLSEMQLELKDIHKIGVGCPGIVNSESGTVRNADNIGLEYIPLKDHLERQLCFPVTVNNDANCAAWGEYLALSNGNINSLVMVTLGTGIGGGIILNKRLYTGCDGSAGEWGAMIMETDHSETVPKMKYFWEKFASASALIKSAEEAAKTHTNSLLNVLLKRNGYKLDGKLFFQALEQKDEVAVAVFAEYIHRLGDGIINIIYILRPDVLVIGGGLSQANLLWKPLQRYLHENSDCFLRENQTKVCKAILGNDAGIIGAAFL